MRRGDVELAPFDVERVADGFEDLLRDERGVLGVRRARAAGA